MAKRWQALQRLVEWLRGKLRPSPSNRRQVGRRGEDIAAQRLQSKGFRILERNYTVLRGEIDLVAFHRGTLVFVEVRSVTAPATLDPALTVTPGKQQRVIRAAHEYLNTRARRRDVPTRFDVVTVVMSKDGRELHFRHIPDAFHSGGRGFS
jgi:putative endonuclease